jgi:hypothetical protein
MNQKKLQPPSSASGLGRVAEGVTDLESALEVIGLLVDECDDRAMAITELEAELEQARDNLGEFASARADLEQQLISLGGQLGAQADDAAAARFEALTGLTPKRESPGSRSKSSKGGSGGARRTGAGGEPSRELAADAAAASLARRLDEANATFAKRLELTEKAHAAELARLSGDFDKCAAERGAATERCTKLRDEVHALKRAVSDLKRAAARPNGEISASPLPLPRASANAASASSQIAAALSPKVPSSSTLSSRRAVEANSEKTAQAVRAALRDQARLHHAEMDRAKTVLNDEIADLRKQIDYLRGSVSTPVRGVAHAEMEMQQILVMQQHHIQQQQFQLQQLQQQQQQQQQQHHIGQQQQHQQQQHTNQPGFLHAHHQQATASSSPPSPNHPGFQPPAQPAITDAASGAVNARGHRVIDPPGSHHPRARRKLEQPSKSGRHSAVTAMAEMFASHPDL